MAEIVQTQNPRERKITKEFLRNSLDYDPLTGIFKWKRRADKNRSWNANYAGRVAGSVDSKGYIVVRITIDGERKCFFASRLAFIYMLGQCPPMVDHKDGCPHNNRWDNLRSATRSQNMHNSAIQSNNKSGFKGVAWHTTSKKWRAMIGVNGKQICLGYFSSPQEAHAVYCAAADKYHGQFACNGLRQDMRRILRQPPN